MIKFHIKQNSTLPLLKFPLSEILMRKYNITDKMMENVGVTFSMTNTDGNYFIANKSGELYYKEINSNELITEEKYILIYKFTERDTRKPGFYLGEFKLDFIENNEGCGKITLPNNEKIQIIITDTITRTTII